MVVGNHWSDVEVMPSHDSLGAAWLHALGHVLTHGRPVRDGPEELVEVLNLVLAIRSVSFDPLLRRYADPARIELMRRKYRSLEVLPPYPMSYGALLYDHDGVDQVQWVVDRIRRKPETKSATITFHRPGASELSCVSLLDFKLRDGRVVMTAVYRSQNVFASQPGTVLALSEVHERVARDLGVRPGAFVLHVLSAHVYAKDVPSAKLILKIADQEFRGHRANSELPSLELQHRGG